MVDYSKYKSCPSPEDYGIIQHVDQIMEGVPADDTLLIMRHICDNDLELRLDCNDGEKGYAICKGGGVLVSGHDIDYLLDDYKKNHMK